MIHHSVVIVVSLFALHPFQSFIWVLLLRRVRGVYDGAGCCRSVRRGARRGRARAGLPEYAVLVIGGVFAVSFFIVRGIIWPYLTYFYCRDGFRILDNDPDIHSRFLVKLFMGGLLTLSVMQVIWLGQIVLKLREELGGMLSSSKAKAATRALAVEDGARAGASLLLDDLRVAMAVEPAFRFGETTACPAAFLVRSMEAPDGASRRRRWVPFFGEHGRRDSAYPTCARGVFAVHGGCRRVVGVEASRKHSWPTCPLAARTCARGGQRRTIVLAVGRHSRAPAACIATKWSPRSAHECSPGLGGRGPRGGSTKRRCEAQCARRSPHILNTAEPACASYSAKPPSTEQVARWSSCTRLR